MKDAVIDRTAGSLDSTARYGREVTDAASEYAQSLPGATVEIFDNMRSNLSDIFRAQPLVLGAIGVAIGAGIAAALPTTEVEADYVGETSDAFRKTATAFAEDQAGRATKVAGNVLDAVSQEARQQGLTTEAVRSAAGDISTKIGRIANVATKSALNKGKRKDRDRPVRSILGLLFPPRTQNGAEGFWNHSLSDGLVFERTYDARQRADHRGRGWKAGSAATPRHR